VRFGGAVAVFLLGLSIGDGSAVVLFVVREAKQGRSGRFVFTHFGGGALRLVGKLLKRVVFRENVSPGRNGER
jgi:hypothetical protein